MLRVWPLTEFIVSEEFISLVLLNSFHFILRNVSLQILATGPAPAPVSVTPLQNVIARNWLPIKYHLGPFSALTGIDFLCFVRPVELSY